MCSSQEVSRAGYYAWIDRPPSAHAVDDQRLVVMVREAPEESGKRYCAPRAQKELAATNDVLPRTWTEIYLRILIPSGASGERSRG
jgi:hypothetical protein